MHPSTSQRTSGVGLSILTLIAIFATLIVNALSNFFPPGGLNIGQIANTLLQGVLITPANYAFAIWGVIYVGLLAYGFYQLRPSQRRQPTIRYLNKLLIIACVAQMIWVYLFTLRLFWLSIIAMLEILIPLIGIYLHLGRDRRPSHERRWFVHTPFSIYLGWISVATIVNVASALYSSGWQGWGIGPIGWTIIMLIISTVIAAIVILQRADIPFTLVFIWAYVAIAVRHAATASLAITAIGLAIGLAVLLMGKGLLSRR